MTTVAVVAVLAVVQSLFGIGLLVFGTPTLLLLGYRFDQTLAILLPASIAISLLQMRHGPRLDPVFARSFVLWCLGPLGVALAALLWLDLHASLHLIVALALATFVGLRRLPDHGERVRRWIAEHQRTWLLLMGVVHGMSNMGGGLLAILAASRHREKVQIRSLVAFCYACFAGSQLVVLAVLAPGLFGWQQLGYAVLSTAVFLVVGHRVFLRVSTGAFEGLLSLLMAGYAIVLGLRFLGLP